MDDNPTTPSGPPGPRRRRMLSAGGLLAAGTLAGGILAGTMSASAAGSSSSASPSAAATAPSQSGTGGPASGQSPPAGGGGATPVRSDEKALSTADAAKVTAAALKAVPGGTVYRVETDAGDGTYEAHVKKADGSLVTVKLDASFAVTKVESGMGQGDPAPAQRTTTSTP
jgi:hypothetical protein